MSESLEPKENEMSLDERDEQEHKSRRDLLRRLGRWSAIIIGGATLAGMMGQPNADAAGWVNARGGGGSAGWVNRAGGGGAAWVNGGGGGAAWVNRSGGWINGGGWVNRAGGGGAAWVNARGGWVNRY